MVQRLQGGVGYEKVQRLQKQVQRLQKKGGRHYFNGGMAARPGITLLLSRLWRLAVRMVGDPSLAPHTPRTQDHLRTGLGGAGVGAGAMPVCKACACRSRFAWYRFCTFWEIACCLVMGNPFPLWRVME